MLKYHPYPLLINASPFGDIIATKPAPSTLEPIDLMLETLPGDTPSAKHYELGVIAFLSQISMYESGRALLSQLLSVPKIWITPYDTADTAWMGYCNAYSWDIEHSSYKAAAGGGIRVHFSPDHFGSASPCTSGAGAQPDEILFHELVHAVRQQSGRRITLPLPPTKYWKFDNIEELIAVMFTNIYLSEKGKHLRKHHADFTKISAPRFKLSETWLDDPFLGHLMDAVRIAEPFLWGAFSLIGKPAFNPPRLHADRTFKGLLKSAKSAWSWGTRTFDAAY